MREIGEALVIDGNRKVYGQPMKIFIAVPNMNKVSSILFQACLGYFNSPNNIVVHPLAEARFHDFARNVCVMAFLESKMEHLLFLDSDILPHPAAIELARMGKPIVAGSVFCHVRRQLVPSIWQLAKCEECNNVKTWKEKKEIIDPRHYKKGSNGTLLRWNAINQLWGKFLDADGEFEPDVQCRCKGTGMDPWVYNAHKGIWAGYNGPFRVDSVGAACMMIHRSVFEKVKPPWFSFLYRETREILLTEDHYFTWKAREAGFEIWANTAFQCGHFKTMDLQYINEIAVRHQMLGHYMGKEGIINPMDVPEKEGRKFLARADNPAILHFKD